MTTFNAKIFLKDFLNFLDDHGEIAISNNEGAKYINEFLQKVNLRLKESKCDCLTRLSVAIALVRTDERDNRMPWDGDILDFIEKTIIRAIHPEKRWY